MNKNSIIMEGRIVGFERLPSKIESRVTIDFIIPQEWEDDFIDKFKEDEKIVFQKPDFNL